MYPSMPCSTGVLCQHALQVVSQHALQQEGAIPACLAAGGAVPGRGGVTWSGGVCSGVGGLLPRGLPGGETPRTATAAGGTHPTGMHSCFIEFFLNFGKM